MINLKKVTNKIDIRKQYLVRYKDNWIAGRFSLQWFGYTFSGFWMVGSIQIEWLDEIYEIIPESTISES